MTQIAIISKHSSARLNYVLNWLFKTVLHASYKVVNPDADTSSYSLSISYGVKNAGDLYIPDAGLLSQTGITPHNIKTGLWNDVPVIYHDDSHAGIPFDLFSALFFLLSRYEEYYSFMPDKYDRYPPEQSILFEHGWLQRPLADEWIWQLYKMLKDEYKLSVSLDAYRFIPTYDIDIAYSYKHKGWKRLAGAAARELLNGNMKAVSDRMHVLSGKKQDPYDCFNWLSEKHKAFKLYPIYFILVAKQTTAFDKNISPEAPEMQALIKRLSEEALTTLHPSYYSNNDKIFTEEKLLIEKLTEKKVTQTRQHYIRLQLPQTYRHLIDQSIHADYSMGYGSRLGFRAGTGRSFPWYDLLSDKETELTIHPFCFMDSTAHYEEKLSTEQALETMRQMKDVLQRTSSQMITVFHNFSLGTDAEWEGWSELYEQFLREAIE